LASPYLNAYRDSILKIKGTCNWRPCRLF